MSWQNFYTFTVKTLDKKQVLELISKIDYDDEIKKRFRREVNRQLYASHASFLSSPLLASIMLLTYEQFAEIPTKMHIFYEQAFGVLFRRHDAQKAQFIRKTYANLPIDDFRNFFSAFCASSYLKERFSFLDDEIRELIRSALQFTGISPNIDDVVKDLCECVCMLQRDGIHTIFVHRSFQEYFCAVFIAAYNGPQLCPMLEKISNRDKDQVIPMLFEMARDKVDLEWVIPQIDKLLADTDTIDDETASVFCQRIITGVAVKIDPEKEQKGLISFEYGIGGSEYWIFGIVSRLYSTTKFPSKIFNAVMRELHAMVDRGENLEQLSRNHRTVPWGTPDKKKGVPIWEIVMTPEVIKLLGLRSIISDVIEELAALREAIKKRIGAKDVLVESLLTVAVRVKNTKKERSDRRSST